MAVTQVSRVDRRVGAGSPRRVSLISRLRRVTASSTTRASACSTASPVTWAMADPWVARAYCTSAPAAPRPGPSPAAPKPSRSRVRKRSVSASRAASTSKCQSGRRRRGTPADSTSASVTVSGQRISDGPSRASSEPSAAAVVSSTRKAPEASDSQASPTRGPAGATASSTFSRRSSSRAASVSVPGVTMRVTCRSTGPLASAGSPICSQMATDSPRRISRARYCSAAWKGTPAMGMGSPADMPRRVRVMSSSRAAFCASS